MSLTMRYLNFWLLHHIETTDKSLAERLVESAQAPTMSAASESDFSAKLAPADASQAAPTTDLERWHRAVRRGLWVAPEPRSARLPASKNLH